MQLRPRHLILLVVIIGLFVFNVVKHRLDQHARLAAMQPQNSLTAPAWATYDKAAALRDAPDDQFKPAFDALRAVTEGPDAQQSDKSQAFTDLVNCKTWLYFYRNPSWKPNATKHVNGCVQYHRDTIA
jgi:hypothetical protein